MLYWSIYILQSDQRVSLYRELWTMHLIMSGLLNSMLVVLLESIELWKFHIFNIYPCCYDIEDSAAAYYAFYLFTFDTPGLLKISPEKMVFWFCIALSFLYIRASNNHYNWKLCICIGHWNHPEVACCFCREAVAGCQGICLEIARSQVRCLAVASCYCCFLGQETLLPLPQPPSCKTGKYCLACPGKKKNDHSAKKYPLGNFFLQGGTWFYTTTFFQQKILKKLLIHVIKLVACYSSIGWIWYFRGSFGAVTNP